MSRFFYDWGGLNAWLFHLVNGFHSPFYDRLMVVLTNLGDHHNFVYYFVFITLLMLLDALIMKAQKEPITQIHVRSAFALLIVLAMSHILVGLVIGVLKSTVHLPRPFVVYAKMPQAMHFIGAYPAATDFNVSFPSGHAATISLLVAALWPVLPRWGRVFGVLLAVMVCWSRLAIGMHFPADVIGGALIGAGVVILVRRYVYRIMDVPYRHPRLVR